MHSTGLFTYPALHGDLELHNNSHAIRNQDLLDNILAEGTSLHFAVLPYIGQLLFSKLELYRARRCNIGMFLRPEYCLLCGGYEQGQRVFMSTSLGAL